MMKQHPFLHLVLLATAIFMLVPGHASSDEKKQEKPVKQEHSGTEKVPAYLVPYIPPKPARPTPRIRTSQGGTRGCGGLPSVTLLAPEHVALTTQEQPRLYWHISADTRRPTIFTLSSDEAVQPLLELRLPRSLQAGVHFLHLSEHDIHLETEKIYEWSIRVFCDQEKSGAGDLVVKSYIKRVPVNEQTDFKEGNSDPLAQARSYASHGIWYDAIATLYDAWTDNPDIQKLKAAWEGLLKQVGLPQS